MEAVLFICAVLGVAAAVYVRGREKATLNRIDEMLDEAMGGDFCESRFDESRLSAVETKFRQYLRASGVQARQIREEKDRIKTLISDISHQTKTPISNILLYAQLLAEQELSPSAQDCVEALESQAEKLGFLIESLVKTSRLEAGILTVTPETAPIAPVLERAVEGVRRQAEEKHLTVYLCPTEESARFDPKWTEEAVGNLLDNAVKYTPDGGHITIRTQAYELFCRVDVTDDGIGIPEPEQAKIFGRFYRSPAVAQQEGVGIGLYLTRQIAAEQGGYVKVSSASGQGSTFSLFLPRM